MNDIYRLNPKIKEIDPAGHFLKTDIPRDFMNGQKLAAFIFSHLLFPVDSLFFGGFPNADVVADFDKTMMSSARHALAV